MESSQKQTVGKVIGGCGCALLVLLSIWMAFVIFVGVQGRGNDEETSIILGGITCLVMGPTFLITLGGLFVGLRSPPEE